MKQFGQPPERSKILVLLVGQWLLQKCQTSIGNGEAAIQLAARDVGIKVLKIKMTISVFQRSQLDYFSTLLNHSRAFSGRLYFFAWSSMVSRKEGKTASKAARGVGAAIVQYAIGEEARSEARKSNWNDT